MLTGHSVYLLHAKGSDFFKIGTTTRKKVHWRVSEIQGSCPLTLRILAAFKSERALEAEREFKSEFAEHRTHGEWFILKGKSKGKALKFLDQFKESPVGELCRDG